ncbi:hypothetical protein AMS68_006018 [Peltaster fructicola]|uniref:Autophagy protein 5 n=1 Tax=Peltaster fructicola TaxID=286661 RepID=A0A6H0Y0Q2_9PEZI|nr:hypothetical protein AMS68_006018 [Peltaster fructicola]
MPLSSAENAQLQQLVWSGSIALEIRLAAADCRSFEDSNPYLIHFPRQSYLGLLLTRLHTFFAASLIDTAAAAHDAWLDFEGVPLKWHYPLGLLYDLYSGSEPAVSDESHVESKHDVAHMKLPWKLTVHYSDFPGDQLIQLDEDSRVLLDAYINNVKEADFIRNGTARAVMSLSKDDSDSLWRAVQLHDMTLFNSINDKLLNPPGTSIKHTPLKVYLPTSATATEPIQEEAAGESTPKAGHFKVVQALVPLRSTGGTPQTVGTALNSILPELFPSRRNPLLAQPVLHGAIVPMSAVMDDLAHACAYLDGFVHLTIVMLG